MCGERALDRSINNHLLFKALAPVHVISSVGVIYRSDNDKAEVSACLHGGNVPDRGLALGIDVLDTAKKGGCKASNTFHVSVIL